MELKSIYACSKHLDKAFDHFLDENEIFPYLQKVKENKNCSYCDCSAEYVLRIKEDTN